MQLQQTMLLQFYLTKFSLIFKYFNNGSTLINVPLPKSLSKSVLHKHKVQYLIRGLIVFFHPAAKQSRQLPPVNNTASPSPTKVARRVRGHTVTPAARGTYGVHMKRTMREWRNSVCGALLLKPKPFSQLFSPSGQNISCMLIFTGQWWPHRAVSVLAHSQKLEISVLPLADVFLVLDDAALDSVCHECCSRFIQSDSSLVNGRSSHDRRAPH